MSAGYHVLGDHNLYLELFELFLDVRFRLCVEYSQIFSSKDSVKFCTDEEKDYLIRTESGDIPEPKFVATGYPKSPIISQLASYFLLIMKTG